jgi:hypothetical protein
MAKSMERLGAGEGEKQKGGAAVYCTPAGVRREARSAEAREGSERNPRRVKARGDGAKSPAARRFCRADTPNALSTIVGRTDGLGCLVE